MPLSPPMLHPYTRCCNGFHADGHHMGILYCSLAMAHHNASHHKTLWWLSSINCCCTSWHFKSPLPTPLIICCILNTSYSCYLGHNHSHLKKISFVPYLPLTASIFTHCHSVACHIDSQGTPAPSASNHSLSCNHMLVHQVDPCLIPYFHNALTRDIAQTNLQLFGPQFNPPAPPPNDSFLSWDHAPGQQVAQIWIPFFTMHPITWKDSPLMLTVVWVSIQLPPPISTSYATTVVRPKKWSTCNLFPPQCNQYKTLQGILSDNDGCLGCNSHPCQTLSDLWSPTYMRFHTTKHG